MRPRPSGSLEKAGTGKSRVRLAGSPVSSLVAHGRLLGKQNWPTLVPRPGNAPIAKQRDAAYKKLPSIGGGSVPDGKFSETLWGRPHMRTSEPGTTTGPDVSGNADCCRFRKPATSLRQTRPSTTRTGTLPRNWLMGKPCTRMGQ
eukprot:15192984-Heterocapsa_arctica.AAC.1